MDAMEAILTRRSIRKYTADPVSDELVEELLRAAMSAPSAGNEQPWHFVVIRDRDTLERVQTFQPYSAMLSEAQVSILVCGDPELEMEKHQGFWIQDCSAAIENLLIAANAEGLGAVWLGVHPVEDWVSGMRALLRIPERVVPLGLLSIGWPAEERGTEDRFDETRVHQDRW
jgi:nitroreductase